jgi:hypothetical protein
MSCNSSPVSPVSFSLEHLEDRRLLSVTAAVLTGPLVKGTAWTYKSTSGSTSVTVTNTVVGTAKVGKVSTWEIDNNIKSAGTNTTAQTFVHLDNRTGLVSYKSATKTTGTGFSSTSVRLPSPYNTTFPATLVAKKTYSFTWTDKVTTTATYVGTTTETDTLTYTVRLASDSLTKVKVPAGTFNCYTIQTTLKTTVNGKATTVSSTEYVAANVGVVKSVSGNSSAVLTKFVKGK